MLSGIETLVCAKPGGLYFLKQDLEDYTSSESLNQITHAINLALTGHRDFYPSFSFEKTDTGLNLHIWNPGYGKRDNIWIAGVKLKAIKLGSQEILMLDTSSAK